MSSRSQGMSLWTKALLAICGLCAACAVVWVSSRRLKADDPTSNGVSSNSASPKPLAAQDAPRAPNIADDMQISMDDIEILATATSPDAPDRIAVPAAKIQQSVVGLDDLAEAYGFKGQYAEFTLEKLSAELENHQQRFADSTIPLLAAEFERGNCEVLPDGGGVVANDELFWIKGVEHNGAQRRLARVDLALHAELLESRIRVLWLDRECRRLRAAPRESR